MLGAAGAAAAITAALEKARVACAALDDDDPKRAKMQTFLDDVARRLQTPPFIRPPLPNSQRRDFVGTSESDPRRPARTEAFDAMEKLLKAWPKPPALTNAEKQTRKRQKQAHAAEAEAGSSSTAILEAPIGPPTERTDDVEMPLAIGAPCP